MFARRTVLTLSIAASAFVLTAPAGAQGTDFPTKAQLGIETVFCTPHLGAGTPEADENCAVMGAKEIIDYLENGNITNAVNFPGVSMGRTSGAPRITFSNDNVAGVLGQVLSVLADHQVNVIDMMNKSRGELAFNIIDVETPPDATVIAAIQAVAHVIRVRLL